MARKGTVQQTIVVPHRMDAVTRAWLDPVRREQSTQTRLAYVRAAVRTVDKEDGRAPVVIVTEAAEKDVRHAVAALHPASVGDSWTLNCAVRQGVAMRRATPDGTAVFGSVGEMRRRSKGLIGHEEWRRRRLLPLVSFGGRLYRGNRLAKLVMTDAGGHEVAARALAVDPLPRKRLRESLKGRAYMGSGSWLRSAAPKDSLQKECMGEARVTALRLTLKGETRLVPLVAMRGKQGRLLARVAWLASMGLLNVTFRVDDDAVHVTFDAAEVADHPERLKPTTFVPLRCLGLDRNPNGIGATVVDAARRDGQPNLDLPAKVVEHILIVPNLARSANAEETAEAMAKAADAVIGLARKRRCGLICAESLRNLGGRGMGRRLNHLLSRWCREKFLLALKRRAVLCGIRVMEVWGGYSTTVGNVVYDLPDACAAAAEMARRGLVRDNDLAAGKTRREQQTQLLPAYDKGHVPGRVRTLPSAPARRPDRRKEGTGAETRKLLEARLSRLAERAEHVSGWRELHRELYKSGVRARRTHPVRGSRLVASARLGPSARGTVFRARSASGGTPRLG